MLLITITVSVLLLASILYFARHRDRFNIALFCGLSLFFCGCTGSMAILAQSTLTALSLAATWVPRNGWRIFSVLAVIAMLVSYIMPVKLALRESEQIERLREEYPVISLEARIPPPSQKNKPTSWSISYEESLPEYDAHSVGLRMLHDEQRSQFVNSPGFGVARMPPRTPYIQVQPIPPSLLQPEDPQSLDDVRGEILPSRSMDGSLSQLHNSGILDFVNPKGFGYIKNRSEVTGFRPHRFSEVPGAKTEWRVRAVELIGILKHDPPRVYLSPNLPRMDELAETKTRPLDAFEREGLTAIDAGKELFARGSGDSLRMIGAIRSAKQCVECHGGQHGDLLGAFSYRLKKP
jgi:hypothetical protein